MRERHPVLGGVPTVNRRDFLRVTGTGVAGASLLSLIDARQAPAQIKGSSLRIVQWSHFIPAYDAWFDKFAREWGSKNGVTVRVDHIPVGELPARYAAEFAAGAGHDIIQFASTVLTALYHEHLVDITDLADSIGKKWGGWLPSTQPVAQVKGRWYAFPDFYILAPMLWRKDLFDQNGLKPPDTWDLARVAGRTLKPKGHPTGIAFSHCDDANLFLRAYLYSHGAKEADGDQILLDSKEMREGLKALKALYDEAMTPEVFSWDNASDNRYLASGVACWIHDAISAYRTTEDTNPDVFKAIDVALEPQGIPGKRVSVSPPNLYAIWKSSKNAAAAKEFLAYLADHWKEAMIASRGYDMPFLRDAYKKPMPIIGSDPKLAVLQDFPNIVAFAGYPGLFTPMVQEVVANFTFPDMCTRVARGQSPDEAIKWAMGEYKRIFSKYKSA